MSRSRNKTNEPPNTRALAAFTLSPVVIGKRSLSSSLDNALNTVAEDDKGLLQTLCLGTLRAYPRLDLIAKKLLDKPLKGRDSDIAALIAIGLYQLEYMRTPDHAAINQTVEAAKALKKPWACKLINGLLREYIREKSEIERILNGSMAFKYAHPQWMIEKLRKDWPTHFEAMLKANNQQPPISLRINKQKTDRNAYLQALGNRTPPVNAYVCNYAQHGVTLKSSSDIPSLPGFAEGAFSVQDEAAQLAGELLDVQPGDRILDACSAPGGKAAHICEQADDIDVTCLEIDAARMKRVEENLKRLGHTPKLIVDDALAVDRWWDKKPFDRILVDAPCSASGVIRRNPDIKLLRREADIAQLAQLQLEMLNTLWTTLKPGGLLVYATCSVFQQENEATVKQFVNDTKDAKHLALKNVSWGIKRPFGRQLFPTEGKHDGFYYARIAKLN